MEEFYFLSVEWLSCTCCGDKFSFPFEGESVYLYTKPESFQTVVWREQLIQDVLERYSSQQKKFLRIPYKRIWCLDCGKASLAERLPSTQEFFSAAEMLRYPSAEIQDQLLSYSLTDIRDLAEGLQARAGAERCLQCGSTNYMQIRLGSDNVVSGVLHKQCLNSPLKWHGSVFSAIPRSPRYVYVLSFDGDLLWKGLLDSIVDQSHDFLS